MQTIGLRTEPARAQKLTSQLVTTAVIKPNDYRIAHVSPRIPGKAVEVYAKLGDEVYKEAVLAELDSLELGEKKAAFLRAKADLDVTRRNYEREKALFAKQISSERDYLAAKGDFERFLNPVGRTEIDPQFERTGADLFDVRWSFRRSGLVRNRKNSAASAFRPSPPFTPPALIFALFGVSIKPGQVQSRLQA